MSSQKISTNTVLKKCRKAGINFWISARTALELKEEIEKQEDKKITEEDLNNRIHQVLKKYNEEAAERFRSYHSISVRTSDGKLQSFDKSKITDSLLKETRVPRTVAKEISEEVSEDIRRLQLHNISSALIREMVNTKLLQRRHIDEKRQYTRIGLPIHDAKQMIIQEKTNNPMQLQEKFAERILEEYTLTKTLPRKLSQEHLKGKIHIHSLSGFITAPEAIENNLYSLYREGLNIPGIVKTGPAKKPEVAASHAARALLTSSQYTSLGVSIDSFNYYMAPHLEEQEPKQIEQTAQTFLYELNQLSSGTTTITVNLDTKTPESLKEKKAVKKGEKTDSTYKEYEKEAKQFLKKFLKVYKKGDYDDNPFKTPRISIKHHGNIEKETQMNKEELEEIPRPLYLLKQGNQHNEKEKTTLNGQTLTQKHLQRGMIQTISLNLPSYPANKEQDLYKQIKKRINTATQITEKKIQNLSKRKKKLLFLEENQIDLEKLPLHVSIYGLIQTAQQITGKNTLDQSVIHQAKKITREIKKQAQKKQIDIKISQKTNQNTLNRFTEEKTAGKNEENLLQLSRKQHKNLTELQRYLNGGTFLESNTMEPLKLGYQNIKLVKNKGEKTKDTQKTQNQ